MGLVEKLDQLSAWMKRRKETKAQQTPALRGSMWGQSSKPFWTTAPAVPQTHARPTVQHDYEKKVRPQEARRWLKKNKNDSPFASNVFQYREDALSLVSDLYKAGAKSVQVDNILNEAWRLAESGGPYADTFLITVASPKKLAAIQRLLKKEENPPNELSVEKKGKGRSVIRAWWD